MAKLTRKQQRALRRAPKRRRAAMTRRFRGGRGDAAALRGIKQGVGRTVARPYGGMSSSKFHPCHFDAFHHAHLPLPRAIGPYSVVRSTQVYSTADPLMIVGPFWDRDAARWSDLAGVAFKDKTKTIGAVGNVDTIKFSSLASSGWSAASVTPAAFSIQVMNPNALQTTNGIVYLGRIRTSLKLSEDGSDVVNDLANLLISYNNPRLCAAAKLAFRGVQIDLVPFNMSELANFTPISSPSFSQYGSNSPNPVGFAPMFIFNPSNIALQFLIAAEWRVRFDPGNPAQATHVYHAPPAESVWHKAQMTLEAMGNGVVDIADRVANTGQAVYNAMGTMYGVARGARALRGAAQLALL